MQEWGWCGRRRRHLFCAHPTPLNRPALTRVQSVDGGGEVLQQRGAPQLQGGGQEVVGHRKGLARHHNRLGQLEGLQGAG